MSLRSCRHAPMWLSTCATTRGEHVHSPWWREGEAVARTIARSAADGSTPSSRGGSYVFVHGELQARFNAKVTLRLLRLH